jgi:hypothetical protein
MGDLCFVVTRSHVTIFTRRGMSLSKTQVSAGASLTALLGHVATDAGPDRRPASARHVPSSSSEGDPPGGFIAGSRDTHTIGAQSRQLADIGNARHICDQLVHDRQDGNRGIDRRHRGRHQNRVVLSSRTGVGGHCLGTTLIAGAHGHRRRASCIAVPPVQRVDSLASNFTDRADRCQAL